jgi:hypothetical protein
MNKAGLLKSIAETGYNVGFGAKKHFATYDIVEKVPGWIGFISTAFGVFGLVFDQLSDKTLAAFLTTLGITALYINFYDRDKDRYNTAGVELTKLYNRLRDLYRTVKSSPEGDMSAFEKQLSDMENAYYNTAISKQILCSDWYAHYKFFWQHQIDWINEQRRFTFWRDKVPLSFYLVVVALLGLTVWLKAGQFSSIVTVCRQLYSIS